MCKEIQKGPTEKSKKLWAQPLYEKMYEELFNGKNIIFVSGSRIIAEECDRFLKKKISNLTNENSRLYTGQNERQLEDFKNIENTWSKLKLIITTTTLTVGVDFSNNNYFHSVFLYASGAGSRIRDLYLIGDIQNKKLLR